MYNFSMYAGGVVFGLGLAVAGAIKPEVVLSFLRLEDLGLALVIGTALLLTLFVYQVIPRLMKKPFFDEVFDGHDGFPVTSGTIVGAIIFGVGWGISGLCPATALAAVGAGNWPILIGIGGMFVGTFIYGTVKSRQMK